MRLATPLGTSWWIPASEISVPLGRANMTCTQTGETMKTRALIKYGVIALLLSFVGPTLAIGFLTILLDGFSSRLWPSTSSDLAAWVQAVGSIAAIAMAYFIGARQAQAAHESAMAIYTKERADQDAFETARKKQAIEESLIAIAAAAGPIRRLHKDGIDLIARASAAAQTYSNARKYLNLAQKNLMDLTSDIAQISAAEVEVGYRDDVLQKAQTALAKILDEIDSFISRLDSLPRTQIAIARPDLVKLLVDAINALHNGAIAIDNHRDQVEITGWLKSAEQALEKFNHSLATETEDHRHNNAVGDAA